MNLTRRSLLKGLAAAAFVATSRFYPCTPAVHVQSEEPVVLVMTGATKGLRVAVLDSDDGTVLFNEEIKEDGPVEVVLDRPRMVDIRALDLEPAAYTSWERERAPSARPVHYAPALERNYS